MKRQETFKSWPGTVRRRGSADGSGFATTADNVAPRLPRKVALAFSVLLLSAVTVAGGDFSSADDFKIPLWNYSASLRGGLGYKDNVLLGHTNAQGSAFWTSSAELMAFRLPTQGWQFNFIADAADVRYFNLPSVDSEQLALAVAQLSKDFEHGWKSTLGVNYLFQNQVFDTSTTYTNQTSVGLILGHTLTPRWVFRKTFDALWVEAEFSGTRQWLDAPLDSYWQFGPRATLGYNWRRDSELAVAYQYARLNYDQREQLTQSGAVITNSLLAFTAHLVELTLTRAWGEWQRWYALASVGFESSRDNGPGFYDYDNYRLSARARYRDEHWEVTAQARASHYEYATQTVTATDAARRRKTMINLSVRAERKLTEHLLAHATCSWDRALSNLDFDDYAASTVIGGLAWTF